MILDKLIAGKTIFIAPLDWGFGHTTRCVPLVKSLAKDNKIIIGVTQKNQLFFDTLFPGCQKKMLPSYNISYSVILPVWLKILMQWPRIDAVIKSEKKVLEKIIFEEKVDVVISDNRFGLYNKNVNSIFVTHQLKLKAPFGNGFANHLNKKYIHNFTEVWVPDYENESERLSGELSDSGEIKIPVKYVGPLSIFEKTNNNTDTIKYDYLFLLSGEEPQRGILEKLLCEKFRETDKKMMLVRGVENDMTFTPNNFEIKNFCFSDELKNLILQSETIICRSGYSTLMDVHVLEKKKLILIPTPGQTEQEYLAKFWSRKFGARVVLQHQIFGEKF